MEVQQVRDLARSTYRRWIVNPATNKHLVPESKGIRLSILSMYLRRSQFLVGLAKALRGLRRDMSVLVWLVKRKGKIANYLKAHRVRKLQLAASNNLLPGWLNTDVFLNFDEVVYLDATRRFPFDDNTF